MEDVNITLTVSLPNPVFAPVTSITFPLRSGMSSAVQSGSGGYPWAKFCPKAQKKVLSLFQIVIVLFKFKAWRYDSNDDDDGVQLPVDRSISSL